MFKKKERDPGAPNVKECLLWNSRAVSQSMNIVIMGFLSIYCSDVLGINIALVGTLLMVSKIFDGFTDIIAGYIIDKTNTPLGKGRPYELCIIGYWVCTVLLFACPSGWELPVKCAWILIMYAMINSIFGTLLGSSIVPYSVRAFNNERKYIAYSSYGGLLSMVGAMIVNVVFPIMMAKLGTSSAGWTKMLLSFAIPCTIIGLLRFIFIPEKYDIDAKTDKIVLKDVWNCLKSNTHIYPIALMVFIYNLVANMGAMVYYFRYIVGDESKMGLISVLAVLMIPFLALAPTIMKRISVRNLCMIGFILCVFGYTLNWFAGASIPMLLFAGIFTGLGVLPVNMFNTLMVYDCADFNEWEGRPRMEATLGVIPGLGQKLGSAVGAFLMGVLLNMAGYISTTGDAVVAQPDSAITMIRALMSFVPAILYVLAAISCLCYKLDKIKPQMRKEINERRDARNAEQ